MPLIPKDNRRKPKPSSRSHKDQERLQEATASRKRRRLTNPIDYALLAEQRSAQVAACSYLLVMILQRLDKQQKGLIGKLVAGVEADRRAIPTHAHGREFVKQIIDETLTILYQAKHR